MANARSNWTMAPRYLALVGDGSYDYRHHTAYADNLVPPLVVMTGFGRAVSDVLFGDTDGDGWPEIATGRMPVHGVAEMSRLLGQIDDFESRFVAVPKALVLADQPDQGGDFIANAMAMEALLAGAFSVDTILNDALGLQAVRDSLAAEFKAGVNVMSYIGHGGRDRLGNGYLTTADVVGLDFGPQQPLMVAMTCAAGQFGLPGSPCLGENLLLKAGRAPIAVWSASGFSLDFQAHQLNALMAAGLASQPLGTRLGDTLLRAVRAFRTEGGDAVSPSIYNLLGDPGLPLNFGTVPMALSVRLDGDVLRFGFKGTPARTYVVQWSARLDGTGWEALRDVVPDATGGGGFTEPSATGPDVRFYRVVMMP